MKVYYIDDVQASQNNNKLTCIIPGANGLTFPGSIGNAAVYHNMNYVMWFKTGTNAAYTFTIVIYFSITPGIMLATASLTSGNISMSNRRSYVRMYESPDYVYDTQSTYDTNLDDPDNCIVVAREYIGARSTSTMQTVAQATGIFYNTQMPTAAYEYRRWNRIDASVTIPKTTENNNVRFTLAFNSFCGAAIDKIFIKDIN